MTIEPKGSHYLSRKKLSLCTNPLRQGLLRRLWVLSAGFGLVLALVLPGPARGVVAPAGVDPYAEVNATWDRFGAVYARVLEHYFDEPDHERIMRAAIDGMLKELDSYSQFFDEESLRQLRQDTSGKFAGLGITVGVKDHYPVIIAPIEGTPADRAGLLPGDLIVAIEGRDSFDWSLDEIVTRLRGEPGSAVRITVARPGRAAHRDVVLVREMIAIDSVALVDEIAPGIGYIGMRQTRFSEDTGHEVRVAIDTLRSRGVRALMLDLRGNPGGLLGQATEVADLFLRRGDPIVTVRERDGRREETRYSEREPAAQDLPLAILIDGGSASAAEIVAGAIQDNDRGVVVGTTSFGKGSVQTIFDLRAGTAAALKLTTALYYTPSGRSIHRRSLARHSGALRLPAGGADLPSTMIMGIILRAPDPERAAAELRARFDLDEGSVARLLRTPLGDLAGHMADPPPSHQAPAGGVRADGGTPDSVAVDGEPHHTRAGREVFGGGGIAPDLEVTLTSSPAYIDELRRHRAFFDFVVEYVGGDTTLGHGAQPVAVDADMLAAFRAFIPRSDAAARDGASELAALRQLAAEADWSPVVMAALDSLGGAIAHQESGFSATLEPYVRAELERELALRLRGKRASLLVELRGDPQVEAAVELLRGGERYAELLGAE